MKKPIQISIPTPCHEDWAQMTSADKGRFCASCQKKVFDFTHSSDREIASILKSTGDACGKFKTSQLNRDLVIPKEKSSLWMAASAAVVGFLTLGTYQTAAQTLTATEQHLSEESDMLGKIAPKKTNMVTGVISDSGGMPIPGVIIRNINMKKEVQTDFDGIFSIEGQKGNLITIGYVGMISQNIIIEDETKLSIKLEDDVLNDGYVMVGAIAPLKERTFFGRIFYHIGNLFR